MPIDKDEIRQIVRETLREIVEDEIRQVARSAALVEVYKLKSGAAPKSRWPRRRKSPRPPRVRR